MYIRKYIKIPTPARGCYPGKKGGSDLRTDSMQVFLRDFYVANRLSLRLFLIEYLWIFYYLFLLDHTSNQAFLLHLPSIAFSLCLSLDLLYYLCPAPSVAQRSQVSPMEPDDKLRLLLQPYTRSVQAPIHLHIWRLHFCKHTQTDNSSPHLCFWLTHIHLHTLAITLYEDGSVNRMSCCVRECILSTQDI